MLTSNLERMCAIDRAWNARSWTDYDNLLADTLVAYSSGETSSHGKREHVARAQVFCCAFPDNRVYTDPYLNLFANEDGSITCSTARITGTMTGPLETKSGVIEPNRREFDVTFTAICKWKDGKITEQRQYFDTELMLSQLQLKQQTALCKGEAMATATEGKVIASERTAKAQAVTNQPDGPGKRVGKRGELVLFGKVMPGGAKLFRERLPQFQAEAAYWEERVGTVHDFRALLFDNDTRILFLITYDGDFKAYVQDIITQAHEWFDAFFPGIWEGYEGSHDPRSVQLVINGVVTSELFYVAHPDVSVRDIRKMKKLSKAVSDLLDAAS